MVKIIRRDIIETARNWQEGRKVTFLHGSGPLSRQCAFLIPTRLWPAAWRRCRRRLG